MRSHLTARLERFRMALAVLDRALDHLHPEYAYAEAAEWEGIELSAKQRVVLDNYSNMALERVLLFQEIRAIERLLNSGLEGAA